MSLNNNTQVWFLRHGKTTFDYDNCKYDQLVEMLSNSFHIPLQEEHGINFEKLPQNIDLICHSSALRAVETADLIKRHLNVEKIEPMDALREVNLDKNIIKKYEYTSIKDSRPDILKRWFNNENKAESFEESMARVKQIELFLQNRQEKNIILVTHGWFLRLLDIYFVQGKKEDIDLSDLLEATPIELGQYIKTTLKPRVNNKPNFHVSDTSST